VPPLIAFLLAASALLARRWAPSREEEIGSALRDDLPIKGIAHSA
jgi:hypothetical protein